jgi:molybdopterin/thiamine biosynthesis adenylyltransferase
MMPRASLSLSGQQHAAVKAHLFPGDGKEAAAILLCSRIAGIRLKLLVRDFILVAHDACDRYPDFLSWPGDYIEQALDVAEQDDLSLVLLHSHPGGLFDFSGADRESDNHVMPAIFAGRAVRLKDETWHGSAIMLEDGAMRAKLYDKHHQSVPIDMVGVYGHDVTFFWNPDRFPVSTGARRPMAFSDDMREELSRLSVCVVGVSGTGSIIAEQVARLGFGEVVLIDHDRMAKKNLNRILNSTTDDAEKQRLKVDVLQGAIQACRTTVNVQAVPTEIGCVDTLLKAAMADVIFCCVDSHVGRQICDLMASAFMQPLFDVGVTIPVRQHEAEQFAIIDVYGRIDYVWPGGATLADRSVFTPESVAAECLAKVDAAAHAERIKEGYMPGSHEEAPSVIALNMRAASACVMEFIARAFPFRHDPNHLRARTLFSLAACEEEFSDESTWTKAKNSVLARGVKRPLLGLPLFDK